MELSGRRRYSRIVKNIIFHGKFTNYLILRPVENVVLATKGLQERNIQLLDGTTMVIGKIVNTFHLILPEIPILEVGSVESSMALRITITSRVSQPHVVPLVCQ